MTKINHDKVYDGKPCKNCNTTQKWKSNQTCVVCTRIKVRMRSPDIEKRYLASPSGKLKRKKYLDNYKNSGRRKLVVEKSESKPEMKIKRKTYYTINKENFLDKSRFLRYGITNEKYQNMLEQQNNSCGICKKDASKFKRKLAIDHCHETGKIRGLLCHRCNTALGLLEDSLIHLQSAMEYLND